MRARPLLRILKKNSAYSDPALPKKIEQPLAQPIAYRRRAGQTAKIRTGGQNCVCISLREVVYHMDTPHTGANPLADFTPTADHPSALHWASVRYKYARTTVIIRPVAI